MSEATQPQAADSAPRQRSLAEWVTFGAAAALLCAVIGIIIYDWAVTPPSAPVLSAKLARNIERINGQFQVPFEVTNTGGQTAESVQVIAELIRDGEVIEDGEQQVDFLSAGESEEGAFLFTKDPGDAELILRVGSYKLP